MSGSGPPPLGGIVLDGSNVIASGLSRAVERLDRAVQWCRAWRPDLPVTVFVDDSTVRRCDDEQRRALERRFEPRDPELLFVRCPPRALADVHVLEHAARNRALIVSNDRFWDHAELRPGTVTVQFVMRGDEFRPYEEATWFTPAGGAARVRLDALT